MDLAAYGNELAQATVEAAEWVERNPDLVRNEREGLLRDLRRAGRMLRTCSRSAARRMAAGVFGPSQAGKSYLISALAMDENNSLTAMFDREEIDFIRNINPQGGKESTGLVTRFTMEKPGKLPDGFPVQTRLLTETDLVKIMANSWFSDIEHVEEPETDIAKSLEELKSRAGASGTGISLDSLEDLQEYLKNNFRSQSRVETLEREYWPTALELGQKLDLEGRIQLYSLLWDENRDFTEFLRQLLQALARVDFAENLFCPVNALVPKARSIIDVATLSGLGNPDGMEDQIEVCTPAGLKTSLPRALVTALVAELVIVMKNTPRDGGEYFRETDLLDFPGYRSRLQIVNIDKVLEKDPSQLRELFLRGKVAYLFQRYYDEKELNNMLLCVKPGNQEVQDLPGVIREWIRTTHGPNPEDRVNKAVTLFFILTQTDRDFESTAGSPDAKGRWRTHLQASFLNYFGSTGWTTEWTPGRPFNNLFLLRNPNFKWETILDIDEIVTGKGTGEGGKDETKIVENGILPKKLDFVEQMHTEFLNDELVRRHFRDVPKSWDALMKLNDGGIGYIRESLKPVCDPSIKYRQLLASINDTRRTVSERLKKFYRSDDREALRKEKEKLSKVIGKSLMDLNNRNRLGQLIRSFSISDSELYDMHREAGRRFRERSEVLTPAPAEAQNQEIDDFDILDALKSDDRAADQDSVPEKEDEAAFYTSFIEGKWVERLHRLADDPDIARYYSISSTTLNDLVGELAVAASRFALKDSLAQDFRNVASYANTSREKIARKQAVIASRTFNTFIDWLGWNPAREPEKPRIATIFNGKSREVFPLESSIADIPELPEKAAPYSRDWLGNWIVALTDLMRSNVDYDGKNTVNVVENTALGNILATFAREAVTDPGEAR